MIRFPFTNFVTLQMIIYNASTNQSQCIQNPENIIMMMNLENDDVNMVPLLPLDYLLHLMFRSNGKICPEMISTPSLNELERFQPVNMGIQYDLYDRHTFIRFAYAKQEQAKTYGQAMLLKGALNAFQPIIQDDVEIYYQLARKLMVEREILRSKPVTMDMGAEMVKIINLEPVIPVMKRRIWQETVAEIDFIQFCKKNVKADNVVWVNKKVIDCRGAWREWKEVCDSKWARNAVIYEPIDAFQPVKMNPIKMAQKYLNQIEISEATDEIVKYEAELKNVAINSLQMLLDLRREKKVYETLEMDETLLSTRCLPILNRVLKTNRKALRIKELESQGAQADVWETEWGDWSNESTQTDDY